MSMSMTEKKAEELEQELCIRYPVIFNDQTEIWLDLENKVNAMSQAFAYSFGLKIRKINVRAKKIDGTSLGIYEMVVSTFFMSDINDRERFFEDSFVLADVRLDIVVKMPFLTMSNTDVEL